MDELLQTVLKVGEINLKCMALLDKANTQTYGTPEPTDVTLTVEKGPFIVVTGHDLKDLQLLLEQTNGKGINIYTHGEMLPAHAYPLLKKFPHLKGNFGTAWQNQQKEFDHIPAPILYTTNCLMPPKAATSTECSQQKWLPSRVLFISMNRRISLLLLKKHLSSVVTRRIRPSQA